MWAPSPSLPPIQANASEEDKLIGTVARPFSPFEVIGDINGDGLGLLSWWGGGAGDAGEEEEEEEEGEEDGGRG